MLYEQKTYLHIDACDKGIKNNDFYDCIFEDCKFLNTKFLNCTFKDCTFKNCSIDSPVFTQCRMQNCIFENCRLSGIKWSELETISQIISSNPVSLYQNCCFRYNIFCRMNLSKYDFKNSFFKNCFFDQCNLQGASFFGCDMNGSELQGCNLQNTDFREAKGWLLDITRNNVANARFSICDAPVLLSPYKLNFK